MLYLKELISLTTYLYFQNEKKNCDIMFASIKTFRISYE